MEKDILMMLAGIMRDVGEKEMQLTGGNTLQLMDRTEGDFEKLKALKNEKRHPCAGHINETLRLQGVELIHAALGLEVAFVGFDESKSLSRECDLARNLFDQTAFALAREGATNTDLIFIEMVRKTLREFDRSISMLVGAGISDMLGNPPVREGRSITANISMIGR